MDEETIEFDADAFSWKNANVQASSALIYKDNAKPWEVFLRRIPFIRRFIKSPLIAWIDLSPKKP